MAHLQKKMYFKFDLNKLRLYFFMMSRVYSFSCNHFVMHSQNPEKQTIQLGTNFVEYEEITDLRNIYPKTCIFNYPYWLGVGSIVICTHDYTS